MKEFIPLASLDNQFGINEDSQIINFKKDYLLFLIKKFVGLLVG